MNLTCKNVTFRAMNNTHNAMTAASYGLHNSFRFCHGVIDVRLIVNRVVVIIVKTAVLIELSIACHVAGDVIVQPSAIAY